MSECKPEPTSSRMCELGTKTCNVRHGGSELAEPAGSARNVTIMEVSIHLRDENPAFSESAVRLRIMDEAAGPFFELECHEGNKIRLDMEDIEELHRQADRLLSGWPNARTEPPTGDTQL